MSPSTQDLFVRRTHCDIFLSLGARDFKTELEIENQQRSNPDELKSLDIVPLCLTSQLSAKNTEHPKTG